MDNPLRFIDPDGMGVDDIIVLSQQPKPGPHFSGHQAVLIGDDKNGWTFYSKDGAAGPSGNSSSGSGHSTIKPFKTLEEFANSPYNTFKDNYGDGQGFATSETDANGNAEQRFTDGYRITTDAATDTKMKAAAEKEIGTPYILTASDCTQVATQALKAGGLKTGETTPTPMKYDQRGRPMGSTDSNFWPAEKQAQIEKSNPGKQVDGQLKLNPVKPEYQPTGNDVAPLIRF